MNNRLLITVAAIVALAVGFWSGQHENKPSSPSQKILSQKEKFQGVKLDPARKLGIPELQSGDGVAFSKQNLEGKWSLLFYGYTHCPDICPVTLNTVAAAKQQAGSFPQVVFVSVDPKRDTAKLVSEYVRYFDKDFIGVTGEEKMLQAMATQMSVVAMTVPSDKPDEYLVDHSSNLLLLNPAVELAAMLRPPHSVQSIQQALDVLIP